MHCSKTPDQSMYGYVPGVQSAGKSSDLPIGIFEVKFLLLLVT